MIASIGAKAPRGPRFDQPKSEKAVENRGFSMLDPRRKLEQVKRFERSTPTLASEKIVLSYQYA